jgi:hypothetical protein
MSFVMLSNFGRALTFSLILLAGLAIAADSESPKKASPATLDPIAASDPAAAKLLSDARVARAVWNDKFPGFSCESERNHR